MVRVEWAERVVKVINEAEVVQAGRYLHRVGDSLVTISVGQ